MRSCRPRFTVAAVQPFPSLAHHDPKAADLAHLRVLTGSLSPRLLFVLFKVVLKVRGQEHAAHHRHALAKVVPPYDLGYET